MTSPPYWGLRKYAGEQGDEPLGLEETPERHIERMCAIGAELWRVLRDDGVLYWNYGDAYVDGNLSGMSWRITRAFQEAGWILRNDLIWHKPNPIPESVAGWRFENGKLRRSSWRHTRAHEYVFQLTKKMQYWGNQEAVREAAEYGRRSAFRSHNFENNRAFNNKPVVKGGSNTGADPSAGRNPRSVMEVPTAPYSGAHYACVDEDTEALTPTGWKRQDELQDGEPIAAYDSQTDTWRWQQATFHRYDYAGEMVSIEKRETSQLLTPNHRCIVRRRAGHQGQDGWRADVVQAHELQPGYELLLSAHQEDKSDISIGQDWGALVGWFITDGHIKHGKQAVFSQSLAVNDHKVNEIRALLEAVGADFTESHRKREWRGRPADMAEFTVNGNVAERLLTLAPDKQMVPALAALPVNEQRAFVDAVIAADGNMRPDGRVTVVQKNKATLDLIQVAMTRLGYKTVLSKRKAVDTYNLFATTKKWLTLRGANGKHNPLPMVHYKGTVWCPSVPTSFWIARRNGKVFITGNTFPPNLIAPLIRATCPRWACPVCGQGWAPVVEKGYKSVPGGSKIDKVNDQKAKRDEMARRLPARANVDTNVKGYRPTCEHYPSLESIEIPDGITPHHREGYRLKFAMDNWDTVPGIVFDPFVGSGTTVMVAQELLRRGVGIDLSRPYLDEQARIRVGMGGGKAEEGLPLWNGWEADGE